MYTPRNILITGASSGLGLELAKQYAGENITLYLTGRDENRLREIVQICEKKGANVISQAINIKDKEKITNFVNAAKNIDMVIANAGISAGTGGGGESLEQIENIFDTNIYGLLNTIYPAIDNMKQKNLEQKNGGQVVLLSSMAGYRGLPSSPAYSASKGAVRIYGEALRGDLKIHNIGVTVITPGYINTPMTDVNNFPMPFKMSVEKAAKLIIRRLRKNPARIAFPFPMYFVMWLLSSLPPFLTDPLFAALPKKPSSNNK